MDRPEPPGGTRTSPSKRGTRVPEARAAQRERRGSQVAAGRAASPVAAPRLPGALPPPYHTRLTTHTSRPGLTTSRISHINLTTRR